MKNKIVKLIENKLSKLPEDDMSYNNCLVGLLREIEALNLPEFGKSLKIEKAISFEKWTEIKFINIEALGKYLNFSQRMEMIYHYVKMYKDEFKL